MEILLVILKIYVSTRIFNFLVMHTYVKKILKEIEEYYILNIKKSIIIPVKYDIFIPIWSELKIHNRLKYKEEYKNSLIMNFLFRGYITPIYEYKSMINSIGNDKIDNNIDNIESKKIKTNNENKVKKKIKRK